MTDVSPLIVPIDVEALVVNDAVRGDAFQRWSYNYRELELNGSAEPPPFGAVDAQFTAQAGTIVQGSTTVSEYYNGNYVKWRLPAALRRGAQDSAAATTTFPKVPNRWLVIRDGAVAWLVESDAPRTPGTPATYAAEGADFLTATGEPTTIGRALALDASGWAEPGTPTYLTAVAPGNLGFSAYQPACLNVFSLVDQTAAGAAGPWTYTVIGWHSVAEDDPLNGVAPEDFAQALTGLGWTLPDGTDPGFSASSTLYVGTVTGVGADGAVSAGGAPPAGDVAVAVGPSSARALTTLVAQQAQAAHAAVDAELLEALVLDLVRAYDQPDGPAEVAAATFASGFKTTTGGTAWAAVPVGGTDAPAPPPLTPTQQTAVDALNQAQAAADAAARTLAALRRRLYDLWFLYELLPAPETSLTQADLAPQLDPTVADGAAGRVVAAAADAAATAQSASALAAAPPPGYTYKSVQRPPFQQAADPVILLANAGAPEIADPAAQLECRLTSQLLSGYTTAAGATVDAATDPVAAPAIGALTGAPWPSSLLGALLADAAFAAQLPAGATPTPAGAVAGPGLSAWGTQPWRPLYLMWRAKYYAIEHDVAGAPAWTFADGAYAWNGAGAAPTQAAVQVQGRILLTPQASVTVGARLQTLLDTTPGLSGEEREALTALQGYVRSADAWDLLSQALDGFTDQLLQRSTGAYPSPALSAPASTPPLSQLIGGGIGNPPAPGGVDVFQAWRSGQLELIDLALVDEWGQAIFVADQSDFPQLVLHRPDEWLPAPASVLAPQPDPLVQLPPALLQGARLNFDLVAATDDSRVLGPGGGVDPICGWILPNHVDQALSVYDATGTALGELGVGLAGAAGDAAPQQAIVWRPIGGTTFDTVAALPHLGPLLTLLRAGTAAGLTAFLEAVDETLWTTVPSGATMDADLATLSGRPLAMVRARLGFELEGPPATDPSWAHALAPVATPAPGWSYAVQLGNLAQLGDGLVGYFDGDDYDTMYMVAGSGVPDAPALQPIGSGRGVIGLTLDGSTEAYVSMLVDPWAAVHATSAILPVVSVAVPPALVADALGRMDLSFRAGPLLTTQRATDAGTALAVPAPAGRGSWTWTDPSGASIPLVAPDTLARFDGAPPVLRWGRLDLAAAFAPPSPKGPSS
jgi:hypothetical protein